MSQTVTINGVSYAFPDVDEENWGQTVTNWAVSVSTNLLQKTGGTFTLSAEVDFGASHGVKSLYFKGRTSTPAHAGIIRLAKTDSVSWRNQTDAGDVSLALGSGNMIEFAGVELVDLTSTQTMSAKTITGTFTGNLTGNVTGDLTGDVTGDITGDITGDVTGNASTATALQTARTIGGTSFDGTSNIAVALASEATALETARTIGGTSFDGTADIAVALAAAATALETPRTIAMTGDVTWSSGSFDGSGNVTAAATLAATQANVTSAANLTTVGALANGSIASGFGAIDNGTSGIESNVITATTNIELDHQGSDPAAPGVANDVILYAKEKKVYTRDGDGTITELGAGGGVGSIDTLFTIQAKSADAATSGSGNDAVFLGGGTLSNATVTLDTTAADLIGADKVFKYNATGDSIRNYWYHEETIYPGYAGKNMVLQLQFYTRNGADSESFRFVARDATKPILSVASDSTNTITGTIDADCGTAAEVGDRIIFKDSSNNIYYRYITVIVKNSGTDGKTQNDNMTYTYSGSDITATGKVLTGVMTDELDYLPLNDITGNEAKTYRKQMSFPDNCTTFQFGFHCLDSDTDIELFYDDIALSANQFLQTSSQGQSEYYHHEQWNSGTASTNSYRPYLQGAADQDTISDLGTVTNSSSLGWHFQARQKIKVALTVVLCNSGTNGYWGVLKKTDLGTNVGFGHDAENDGKRVFSSYATASEQQTCCAQVIMEPNEYLYIVKNDTNTLETEDEKGMITMTATPLVNDVVLLNSQNEIFTDWVDYTPGNLGSGSNWNVSTNVKFSWRRIGGDMEIRGFFTIASGGATPYNAYVGLPSGYTIDQGSLNGTSKRDFVGSWVCPTSGTVDYYGGTNGIAGVFFTTTTDSSNIYFSRQGSSATELGLMAANAISASNSVSLTAKVPIAGWTSTFNPVLSMPLVDLGTTVQTAILKSPNSGRPSGQDYGASFSDSTTSGSGIFTLTNDTTSGCRVTINQRCRLFMTGSNYVGSNDPSFGFYKNLTDAEMDVSPHSQSAAVNDDKLIMFAHGPTSTGGGEQVSGYLDAMPGDVITVLYVNNSFVSTGDAWSGNYGVTFLAEKTMSDTNLAHIIKPAVCYFSERYANGEDGGNSGTNSWCQLYPNTFEGETWFIEGYNGSLGTDGDNWQFKLSPGMYEIWASQPVYRTGSSRLRLRQQDDGIVYAQGVTQYAVNAYEGSATCNLFTTFTLTEAKYFAFHVWTASLQANNGLGVNAYTPGGDEYYLTGYIRKLK